MSPFAADGAAALGTSAPCDFDHVSSDVPKRPTYDFAREATRPLHLVRTGQPNPRPRAILVLLSIGLPLLAGCGEQRPTRVSVSGQVLIDGEPLTFGHIRFIPKGARPSEGKLDEDGRFTLTCYDDKDGAVLGVHKIEVSASEPLSPTQIRWHAPKKYANFMTSDLQQEITGATDDVVIRLTWDGGKPYVEGAPEAKSGPRRVPRRGQD